MNAEVASPAFRVIKPGLLTSIQDLGRAGYQRYGISCGGAMDAFALRVANRLVGNPDHAAGLEITLLGPELLGLADCLIAITGADLSPVVDEEPAPIWESFRLRQGERLHFGKRRRGARAYLAVAGGFQAAWVLGSHSTDLRSRFGGLAGRALHSGDVLLTIAVPKQKLSLRRSVLPEGLFGYRDPFVLRVLQGPQVHCFSAGARETFFGGEYTVTSNSNRMGYQLLGPQTKPLIEEIISDAIPLGGIQVLPNGRQVLLMADRQTLGGYPKVAVLISADVPKAAQLNIGHRVRFHQVSLREAHALLRAQEERLAKAVVEF